MKEIRIHYTYGSGGMLTARIAKKIFTDVSVSLR